MSFLYLSAFFLELKKCRQHFKKVHQICLSIDVRSKKITWSLHGSVLLLLRIFFEGPYIEYSGIIKHLVYQRFSVWNKSNVTHISKPGKICCLVVRIRPVKFHLMEKRELTKGNSAVASCCARTFYLHLHHYCGSLGNNGNYNGHGLKS